jgi:hypothetical protein
MGAEIFCNESIRVQLAVVEAALPTGGHHWNGLCHGFLLCGGVGHGEQNPAQISHVEPKWTKLNSQGSKAQLCNLVGGGTLNSSGG